MNRIISFVALMLCYMASLAQNTGEHLTFKGVPIDGSLKEYVSKMESAGFSYAGTKDGIAILQGDFASVKGCIIGVSTLENTDMVNMVAVIFPKKEDWSSLESDYQGLKMMLTEKYGEPAECIEEFQGYGSPIDNNDKFHHLRMDKCTYETTFETPKGNITLSLGHQGRYSCFVRLIYLDKINTEAVKAKVMDDL